MFSLKEFSVRETLQKITVQQKRGFSYSQTLRTFQSEILLNLGEALLERPMNGDYILVFLGNLEHEWQLLRGEV